MIWHVHNENFILDSTRIFMKAFHLLLFDGSFIFPECILISGLILFLMIDSTSDQKDRSWFYFISSTSLVMSITVLLFRWRAVQTIQAFQIYRKHTSCRWRWRPGRSRNAKNANEQKQKLPNPKNETIITIYQTKIKSKNITYQTWRTKRHQSKMKTTPTQDERDEDKINTTKHK